MAVNKQNVTIILIFFANNNTLTEIYCTFVTESINICEKQTYNVCSEHKQNQKNMNRKTTIAAVALLAMAGATAKAQTDVVVTKLSGEQQRFELADVGKFYFGDGAMNVVSLPTKAVTAIPLSGLLNIKFLPNPDGIDNIIGNDNQGVKFAYDGNRLSASGINGAASAAIFSSDGRKMMSAKQWDGTPVETSSLPKGVYIFKVNNNTFKFIKK